MESELRSESVADNSVVDLTAAERKDVDQHVSQRTPVIFEIVRRSGEEELGRPALSLVSSGIAAGLSMGFSILTEASLKANLNEGTSSVLISKLGYSVGFIIVIMAHQQLFTENTLTAIIPFIASPSLAKLRSTLRLSAIVLIANLIGTSLIAAFFANCGIIPVNVMSMITEMSSVAILKPSSNLLVGGVGAGFLIASLVWILANVESGKLWLIILITYLIALFDFSHIIAGSVEGAFLVLSGKIGLTGYISFLGPTLLGNVIGGSGLFALLAYGQIHAEVGTVKSAN